MAEPHIAHHREDPETLVEGALGLLREHRVRVTGARRRMLRVLAQRHEHLTADDVAEELRGTGIHRATVYRTLEVFAELGIVTDRTLSGGATAYHLASADHLHGHCTSCGRVIALPADALDDVARHLLEVRGFALDQNRSSLLGVCEACRTGAAG